MIHYINKNTITLKYVLHIFYLTNVDYTEKVYASENRLLSFRKDW